MEPQALLELHSGVFDRLGRCLTQEISLRESPSPQATAILTRPAKLFLSPRVTTSPRELGGSAPTLQHSLKERLCLMPPQFQALVLLAQAGGPYLHRIFSAVAGYIPRVVFGQGGQNIVVLLLPVQRGQHIDVTLVGGGWNQVLHRSDVY